MFERKHLRGDISGGLGPMSFGAANGMTRRLARLTTHDVLILDLLDVPSRDSSAARAIESIVQRAQQCGQAVILVGINRAVARMFSKLGIMRLLKETERLPTRLDALRESATDPRPGGTAGLTAERSTRSGIYTGC